jgi:hypothetical protein
MPGKGKKPRRRPGSARRPKVEGLWHNMPNGKRVKACGEIMRIGSQVVEIRLTDAPPPP